MKRKWTVEQLDESWRLSESELELVNSQRGESNRLGFGLLFKWFDNQYRFPQRKQEIPRLILQFIAQQLNIDAESFKQYEWEGRTPSRHRQQIRGIFGFREATNEDAEQMMVWLVDHVVREERASDILQKEVYRYCREQKIEPPSASRIERLIRSSEYRVDEALFAQTMDRLSATTRTKLDQLVKTEESEETYSQLHRLRQGAGKVSVKTILGELEKLDMLAQLQLPEGLFVGVPASVLKSYRTRMIAEELHEIRRHPDTVRYTLLSAYCWERRREVTDTVVDLLLLLIHQLTFRAERRVDRELLSELKRVKNKGKLLYDIAGAALEKPDGTIETVIHPVADEGRLQDVVDEYEQTGGYIERVQVKMRSSYSRHTRKMMRPLLMQMTFCANNPAYQPMIDAVSVIKRYVESKNVLYPETETVPLDGVVPDEWRPFVVTMNKGKTQINRMNYEICVLKRLRELVRCRAIWVVHGDRYRNPDADVPADFDEKRDDYYAALPIPRTAEAFIKQEKAALTAALTMLNEGLPTNEKVELTERRKQGWITLSPLKEDVPPPHLEALKTDVAVQWPWVSLLDVLKECEFRLQLTRLFKSATDHQNLPQFVLQKRLLLCLYGMGTNIGLRRVAAGDVTVGYRQLQYVQRRFISRDGLRLAISAVANGIFQVRSAEWWGEQSTSCASDSKKFGAWDQNLLTEWHIRYRGPGVMVYWHVEKKSVCIYSQLKRCSSSEAAAMIEGVLRHSTSMEVTKQYVDTHGQSEVAFAFSHLLGFQLMPRLKGIGRKKLYVPDGDITEKLSHLTPILVRKPIDWTLIAEQYDEMVKYTTALRLGTASAESILYRFTRNSPQHPTYRALQELGRARRTVFLCGYLHNEATRREINAGLNVIEDWNSANDFVFFGKNSELATNNLAQQEMSLLSLHLLQICLVYINTLMLQQVLAQPAWQHRLTDADRRGLSPLFYRHITPYGSFRLDMDDRLDLNS